jgi:hypothetical protein
VWCGRWRGNQSRPGLRGGGGEEGDVGVREGCLQLGDGEDG